MHAAYNPRMFRPQSAGEPPNMVLATGGQDQRVAVWHEAYHAPQVCWDQAVQVRPCRYVLLMGDSFEARHRASCKDGRDAQA